MPKARPKKSEILVINNVALVGLRRFPPEQYTVLKEAADPDAIVVRSQDLHRYEFGSTTSRWPRSPSAASRCSTRQAPTPTR